MGQSVRYGKNHQKKLLDGIKLPIQFELSVLKWKRLILKNKIRRSIW